MNPSLIVFDPWADGTMNPYRAGRKKSILDPWLN
jgi:hypothetical protein